MPAPTPPSVARRRSPSSTLKSGHSLRQAAALAAAAAVGLAAGPALAQAAGGGGDITTFLQNIVNLITGTPGRLVAVIAICVAGIGALMGALSLRAVGGVLLGVMLIFSSAWLVDQIVGA